MRLYRINRIHVRASRPGFVIPKVVIFCLLSIVLTLLGRTDFCYAGGATSGGGDDDGIEVKQVLRIVTEMIRDSNSLIYSTADKKVLLEKSSIAKIIMTDDNILVESSFGVQKSAGFSSSDENETVMKINRKRWQSMKTVVDNEAFVHHELAVLAGIESTGDYHLTDQFKKVRSIFWEKMFSRKIVCSINLFSKEVDKSTNESQPGNLVGAAGLVMSSSVDITGGWRIVKTDSKDNGKSQAVIFRYVTSGNGYLRGVFSDAIVAGNPTQPYFYGLKNDSKETVFYTPYNLLEIDREANLKEWNGYYTMISCSKL